MASIRDLGVALAIDDFGSGAASCVALHQFPINVLKVDRSLIGQIEHSTGEAALLHGLVVMARKLNIKLVAEGIESLGQLRAVQELGCDQMQGYYFAKPMEPAGLEAFLKTRSTSTKCVAGALTFTSDWSERLLFVKGSTT